MEGVCHKEISHSVTRREGIEGICHKGDQRLLQEVENGKCWK